jgi:hypothetical protein
MSVTFGCKIHIHPSTVIPFIPQYSFTLLHLTMSHWCIKFLVHPWNIPLYSHIRILSLFSGVVWLVSSINLHPINFHYIHFVLWVHWLMDVQIFIFIHENVFVGLTMHIHWWIKFYTLNFIRWIILTIEIYLIVRQCDSWTRNGTHSS